MGKNTHITFNVDAEDLRDANEFRRWRDAAKPKYLFILNGLWLARETKAKYPDCVVIHRVFDPFNDWPKGNQTFDNSFWQMHSVDKLIAFMNVHLANDKHLLHTVGYNEPSHNDSVGGKTLDDMLNWYIELMDKARANGFKLAIGEIASAKTIKPEDVEKGRWDNFLRALKRHQGWHIASFHDYTTGILPATLMPNYPENLFNRDALQESNWPQSLPSGTWGWHFLRHELLEQRSMTLGLGRFAYGVTEFSWDMMSDINNHNQALDRLKSNFGMPEYNHDLRGITSHRRYFAWVLNKATLSDTEFGAFAFAQSKWAANIYPDECLFQANFAWNQDWELPEGADYSVPSMRPYRDMLANYSAAMGGPTPVPPPPPPPTPDPVIPMLDAKIRSKATEGTRIRQAPLNGAILGIIPNTWVNAEIQADYSSAAWPKLVVNGLSGYASREWLEIEIESEEKLYTISMTFTIDKADAEALFAELQKVLKP